MPDNYLYLLVLCYRLLLLVVLLLMSHLHKDRTIYHTPNTLKSYPSHVDSILLLHLNTSNHFYCNYCHMLKDNLPLLNRGDLHSLDYMTVQNFRSSLNLLMPFQYLVHILSEIPMPCQVV